MSAQVEELRGHFTRLREMNEWGKQSHNHAIISMAFRVEALANVAEAALNEHASHFEQYRDDKDGCATCFYLNELVK